LKNNNNVIKRAAKNLLFNIKLLLFIDENKITEFYNKIKNKYYSSNKNFFKYFENVFFKMKPYKDKQWNYSNFINDNEEIRHYFFTNNICESLNRTIKSFFKYSDKSFFNFEICLRKIIDIYNNHLDYIEKDIPITRVLAYWCKNNEINDLLDYKELDNMKIQYKNYYHYSNDENNQNDFNDISDSVILDDNNAIYSSSNISSNFISNSSEEEQENNYIIEPEIINNNSGSSGDVNSQKDNDNINNKNKKIKKSNQRKSNNSNNKKKIKKIKKIVVILSLK